MNVAALGAGGWGIALANLLTANGHNVILWGRNPEEALMLSIERENRAKLPGIRIDRKVRITSDMESAICNSDAIILTVPSSAIRETAIAVREYAEPNQLIINAAKGFELETLMTLSEVVSEILPFNEVAVLSGPSHAEEVARGIPTAVLAASANPHTVHLTQDIFMNDAFRVYGCSDVLGVEIGGAIKNVIALAAGMIDGIGCGDNTKAALMTRGLAEICRLGRTMGASPATFYGLSGIGDLIVTCTSMNSRNRRAGILIGKGYSMERALKEVNMVVEGVYAAEAGVALAEKYDIPMPITEAVYGVLYKGENPAVAIMRLMKRDRKFED